LNRVSFNEELHLKKKKGLLKVGLIVHSTSKGKSEKDGKTTSRNKP
jgi:hypothetical protein